MKPISRIAALFAATALASAAHAAILPAATTADVQAALNVAQAGDSIALAAGTYSGLSFYHQSFPGSGITITSADPAHPAILTNFNVEAVDGLTFLALDMKVLVPNWSGFNIYGGHGIRFDHVHVYGPPGAPDPNVQAVNFFDSTNIAFTNSEIEQVSHGLSVARSTDILVSGNHIHHVNSDTLDFTQDTFLEVSTNVLHDFYPTEGNHPDAMQFGTYGTATPSHDLLVTDNLIYGGAGQGSQGIFMGDEVGTLPFQSTTLSKNVIIDFSGYAVRPTHNVDVTLAGNTLVSVTGKQETLALVQFSDRVTATGNITTIPISFGGTSTNVTETGDTTAPAVSQAQANADIQAWFAVHPSMAWANQAAPIPPPDQCPALLVAANAQVASLTQQLADAKAGWQVSLSQVAALQAQLATATANATKYSAGLNTVISLGTTALARRRGPTAADVTAIVAAARTALR